MKRVTIKTAWGEINTNARYSEKTGLFYFKTDAGDWLNYEPGQASEIRP